MKKINDNYPDLQKYHISENFEEKEATEEMIELIKEWIPIHLCVGLIWGKTKPIEKRKQSQIVRNRCKFLRNKILAFDFYGSITFVVNSVPLILEIYYDDELEEKETKWIKTQSVNFDFEWVLNK